MPAITELREDIQEYVNDHGLAHKWVKAKRLFENNPSHPSLHTELLEPEHRLIYSFRVDRKYRALFICLSEDEIEVIAITPRRDLRQEGEGERRVRRLGAFHLRQKSQRSR